LKEEALDRTMWRAGFGRGFGPVVRQTAKWMIKKYRGADKSLARPGRKQATATEYFEFHIFYL
jgi:hypothetical protein